MATSQVPETMPHTKARTAELRTKFESLVITILEDDTCGAEVYDQALTTLAALKRELKLKKVPDMTVPEKFKCPISKEIMTDPVVLTNGLTYDRPYINKWLKEVNRTCPQTREVLSHTILTPNQLVKDMISEWCEEHELKLPKHTQDDAVFTDEERKHFNSLLEKMSLTLSDVKGAAKELRQLSKSKASYRALFSSIPDAIGRLFSKLSADEAAIHPDLQDDMVTLLHNIFILNDEIKQRVAEVPDAIALLIVSLSSGTSETKKTAATALFSLSKVNSNKIHIARSGALKPLVELLNEENQSIVYEAARAIFELCLLDENKGRAADQGAVDVIIKRIKDGMLVEELLSTLALLASSSSARAQLQQHDAVPFLLGILRGHTSEINKENCVLMLHIICANDLSQLKVIWKEETTNSTFSKLAKSSSGTRKAKKLANAILKMMDDTAGTLTRTD